MYLLFNMYNVKVLYIVFLKFINTILFFFFFFFFFFLIDILNKMIINIDFPVFPLFMPLLMNCSVHQVQMNVNDIYLIYENT